MILTLLNLLTLFAYFSAYLASKGPSVKQLWCWRIPRMPVIGALINVTLVYVSYWRPFFTHS